MISDRGGASPRGFRRPSAPLLLALGSLGAGCGGAFHPFPMAPTLWEDPDRHPIAQRPEPYFSGQLGDALDQTVFRPISRGLRLPRDGESVNVNAMDEVPASSWFEPRLGHTPISPERLAQAACSQEVIADLDEATWKVTGAKPDGANPGFFVENAEGTRFLMKFDRPHQPERATAAEVLGSVLFWGAGYLAPCNRIVHFRGDQLEIAEGATAERADGSEDPLDAALVDKVLASAHRLPDGRFRGMASEFLPGRPIGPFRYEGTRRDDPNDVVPHEERRELRAARLVAAWTRHFDVREQNTLTIWVENPDGPGGWVEHYYLDFGDCFGDLLVDPALNPRIGHAFYFDFGYLFADFFTFGAIERPWDRPRFGPGGTTFGYYDVDDFDPDRWKPGYGNPAFDQMTDRDGAWMARILAHFSDSHLAEAVRAARLSDPAHEVALFRVVAGRRDRILERYLARRSALTQPHVLAGDGSEPPRLCLRDLTLPAGLVPRAGRRYEARAWAVDRPRGRLRRTPVGEPLPAHGQDVCLSLPAPGNASSDPDVSAAAVTGEPAAYLVVDVIGRSAPAASPVVGPDPVLTSEDRGRDSPSRLGGGAPARVHLAWAGGGEPWTVVGLERPAPRAGPPGS